MSNVDGLVVFYEKVTDFRHLLFEKMSQTCANFGMPGSASSAGSASHLN